MKLHYDAPNINYSNLFIENCKKKLKNTTVLLKTKKISNVKIKQYQQQAKVPIKSALNKTHKVR